MAAVARRRFVRSSPSSSSKILLVSAMALMIVASGFVDTNRMATVQAVGTTSATATIRGTGITASASNTNTTAMISSASAARRTEGSTTTDTSTATMIDLFVFTRYLQIGEDGIGWEKRPCIDESCSSSSSGKQCSYTRGFVPTKVCYRYLDGYDMYTYNSVNQTMVLTSYEDENCSIPKTSSMPIEAKFDSCTSGSSFHQKRLSKFCILSTNPVGQYQYPLIHQLTYDTTNRTECRTNEGSTVYPSWYIVHDNNNAKDASTYATATCIPHSVIIDDTNDGVTRRTHGGYIAQCGKNDDNSTGLSIQYYSNPRCLSQDGILNGNRKQLFVQENNCTKVSFSSSQEFYYSKAYNCKKPNVHCKSLSSFTNYAIEVPLIPTAPTTPTTPSPSIAAATTKTPTSQPLPTLEPTIAIMPSPHPTKVSSTSNNTSDSIGGGGGGGGEAQLNNMTLSPTKLAPTLEPATTTMPSPIQTVPSMNTTATTTASPTDANLSWSVTLLPPSSEPITVPPSSPSLTTATTASPSSSSTTAAGGDVPLTAPPSIVPGNGGSVSPGEGGGGIDFDPNDPFGTGGTSSYSNNNNGGGGSSASGNGVVPPSSFTPSSSTRTSFSLVTWILFLMIPGIFTTTTAF